MTSDYPKLIAINYDGCNYDDMFKQNFTQRRLFIFSNQDFETSSQNELIQIKFSEK